MFWDDKSVTLDIAPGMTVNFPGPLQTYRPESAEPLLTNEQGEVFAVANRFGLGRAILLGFAPSLLFPVGGGKYDAAAAIADGSGADKANAIAFIRALTRESGLAPACDLMEDFGDISVRVMESKEEKLIFLCNHGEEVAIDLPESMSIIARSGAAGPAFDKTHGSTTLPRYAWVICSVEQE
jgi:hypothetical protein